MAISTRDFKVLLKGSSSGVPQISSANVTDVDSTDVPISTTTDANDSSFVPDEGVHYTFTVKNSDQHFSAMTIRTVNVKDISAGPERPMV